MDALDRSDQTSWRGKLEATDNQIDTTTGTLKAARLFDNTDSALFPNQFVNARLLLKTLQNVILIPSSAIQHNGDVSYVYPDSKRRRPICITSSRESAESGMTRCKDSIPEMWSPTAVLRSCRTAPRSPSPNQDSSLKQREQCPVSPSRPFILRPVATSLLMAAIMLVGSSPTRSCRSPRCLRLTTRPFRCSRSIPAPARTWWRPP